MDYQTLGKSILEKVGGEKNISALNHCATRLRFNLNDDSIPVDAEVKAIPGVMGVVKKGGQYQVVIGSDVANVYKAINGMTNIQDGSGGEGPKEKKKILDVVIDTMSGIFTPILPAITAAGMIKAVGALFVGPIADKISPKPVKFFTKPLITIFVTGLVGLIVIGPIGYIISNYVADGVNALNTYCSWLVPVLVGTLTPLLVMTGTHYGLVPIGINNRMMMGYDTLIYPGMLASNVAQGGAALAVSIKSKKTDVKSLASSAGITAVCGITEPALYGVNLRFKTPLYASMIAGGIGGLFMGIFGVKNFSGGSPGFLTLPSYIGDDTLTSFYFACIGAVISVVLAFVITLVIFKDEEETTREEKDDSAASEKKSVQGKEIEIFSPIKGEAVELSEVDDPTFAEEILGKGAAIIPSEGKVSAPFDGTVISVFDTKHAIALQSVDGLELLIHIGLDTVKLNGKHYDAKVSNGDKIKKGQELIVFDMDKIKKEGYDIVTPVVVTNPDDYSDFDAVKGSLSIGDSFMKVK